MIIVIIINTYYPMQRICGSLLKVSERVKHALAHNLPVVALQSTIISHGMPYPDNKKCALSIENMIREYGAQPATIAIFNGKIHVGLQEDQIELLASTGRSVRKVSRRDLPYIISTKGIGATTVSATMIGAYAANIDVFVTGGIGGVHRGFEKSLDISADLQQLGNTPVAVVSAGVKSILDIPKTLQYLQTKGVPVLTYKSKYFPAFFSESSGLLSPFQVKSTNQAAQYLWAHQKLGLKNGILIAVPNDKPAESKQVQEAITKALKQSETLGISGAETTPFLLKRVNELTQGKSLESNISLVLNNARIGAQISSNLSQIRSDSMKSININFPINSEQRKDQQPVKVKRKGGKKKIISIGGAAIDYQYKPTSQNRKFELYKSCAGKSRKTLGGVARNIAQCCSRFQGFQINLISAFGNDKQKDTILKSCQDWGIEVFPILGQGVSAKYLAIMDENNNQLMGISEMQINQLLTFKNIQKNYLSKMKINSEDIVILDSNICQQSLLQLTQYFANKNCLIIFQAKGQKTRKIITSKAYQYINILKMNEEEKKQIEKALIQIKDQQFLNDRNNVDKWLSVNIGSKIAKKNVYTSIKSIITNQNKDIKIIDQNNLAKHEKVPQVSAIKKATGAGDTFVGTLASMLILQKDVNQALKLAKYASKINIETDIQESTISTKINYQQLQKQRSKYQ